VIRGTGIWSASLRFGDPGEIADAAAELESLGYSALWIPDVGGDVFGALEHLLATTSRVAVATGVLNVWRQTPEDTNAWWAGLGRDEQARVMLGLGVSHGPLIGETWGKPLATMTGFLDALEIPIEHRCVAALGPKMLDLARDRSAGAHPYLVTPEHTAMAREVLGADALLAPEQGVVLETDPEAARAIAREELKDYAQLPNYANNWRRLGFTDDEIDARSDRLVDALFAWGDVDVIAERIAQHRAAGANHVCVQVVPSRAGMHRDAWRALAGI
jgi:probable F420-dependent oxidoreductase